LSQVLASIHLRPVTVEDSHLLFGWRNDSETRRVSRNAGPITWDQHDAWLRRKLQSPDSVMKIAEVQGRAAGVVRADRNAEGWDLSWTVAPAARRKGIGAAMLKSFVGQLDGRLVAIIRCDNQASRKIAAAAGLVRVGLAEDKNFEQWVRAETRNQL
jgi:UDP-2,4-diacetamido-2,4,6-trideoxy-beta-L-altropyranose hydrolase